MKFSVSFLLSFYWSPSFLQNCLPGRNKTMSKAIIRWASITLIIILFSYCPFQDLKALYRYLCIKSDIFHVRYINTFIPNVKIKKLRLRAVKWLVLEQRGIIGITRNNELRFSWPQVFSFSHKITVDTYTTDEWLNVKFFNCRALKQWGKPESS